MSKPITLTLSFSTTEQAHHVLNAYHEAMGFGGTTGVSISAGEDGEAVIPTYKPAVEDDEDEAPAEVDARGVPYHPDFHSGSKKQSADGAWNRRKNHDRSAADVYEAGYLGKSALPSATGTAPAANSPVTQQMLTVVEFRQLWQWTCDNGKVTMNDQNAFVMKYGAHPMEANLDGVNLSAAYAWLQQKANA